MSERGLKRSTVVIHEKNEAALELLRPHFANPESAETLSALANEASQKLQTVNVAQVQQLSPFRYAGGKTWLVPEVRRWVAGLGFRPSVFVEPFAGGAIVGVTMAVEGLADKVVLSELDPDVAAVWKVVFGRSNADAKWLFDQILGAELTEPFVRGIIEAAPKSLKERAFRTIIKNRCQRGGILAPGAGLVKAGENGKGLLSRWYPKTLVTRMTILREVRARVQFIEGDAFEVIAENASNPTAAFLVDPPYSLGGKKAGSRLYLHNSIDHPRLFEDMSKVEGRFLMTYDDAPEVVELAASNGLVIARVPMKNTHHAIIYELLIKKA
jgi:DNA adenine methylase